MMATRPPVAGSGGRRLLLVGLDDTDMPGTPGTNQLARRIADGLPAGFTFDVVLRHQLLQDPRIPYTSHNGCASIGVRAEPGHTAAELLEPLRRLIRGFAPPGSDPGLCICEAGSPVAPVAELVAFAARCEHEPVRQDDALDFATRHAIHLEPLGGTGDGIVGALAAVGLRAGANNGRVVHRPGWPWPDPFAGPQPVTAILARGVDEIRVDGAGLSVTTGVVDLGTHLRPGFRDGKVVLFVKPAVPPEVRHPPVAVITSPHRWEALKLP